MTVAQAVGFGQRRPMFGDVAHDGRRGPGTKETVTMLAGLMALNSFAIDSMIPALPDIARDLHVANQNQQQLVVILYMVGFGATQLVWGPLADRFGRKPVLAAGLALYAGFALLCGVAWSFALLLVARLLQGGSAAASRVLVVAMVRDLFQGEAMARVMSLVFMTFMIMPVLAPSIGQAILLVAPWRAIFLVLAGYGLAMLGWSWLRLPETFHREHRRSLHWRQILDASWEAVREPQSRGYTLANALVFGCLIAYIASIQQVIAVAFDAPWAIAPVFAAIAGPTALASWINSRTVGRLGLRRITHSAAGAFAIITLAHAAIATVMNEGLAQFVAIQAVAMIAYAFTSANLSSLAMEHMGRIAGTASSVQGLVATVGGSAVGYAIGAAFDGTVDPLLWGVAGAATGGLAVVILTEPKRLFAGPTPARAIAPEALEAPPEL